MLAYVQALGGALGGKMLTKNSQTKHSLAVRDFETHFQPDVVMQNGCRGVTSRPLSIFRVLVTLWDVIRTTHNLATGLKEMITNKEWIGDKNACVLAVAKPFIASELVNINPNNYFQYVHLTWI